MDSGTAHVKHLCPVAPIGDGPKLAMSASFLFTGRRVLSRAGRVSIRPAAAGMAPIGCGLLPARHPHLPTPLRFLEVRIKRFTRRCFERGHAESVLEKPTRAPILAYIVAPFDERFDVPPPGFTVAFVIPPCECCRWKLLTVHRPCRFGALSRSVETLCGREVQLLRHTTTIATSNQARVINDKGNAFFGTDVDLKALRGCGRQHDEAERRDGKDVSQHGTLGLVNRKTALG